jgi:hypothetical protein
MSLDVPQELQLSPVDLRKSYGAGGLHKNEVFEAFLEIVFTDSFGNESRVGSNSRVAGIPDLHMILRSLPLETGDECPKRLIGLLGRDFLRHATLIYQGSRGIVEVVLDPESFQRPT